LLLGAHSSRRRWVVFGLDGMTRAPRTAFVLSGGASLGAMQAGMLRALYERGITADLLVGTSAGALNAAFIASRSQTPGAAKDLANVWRGLCRDDVFPIHMPTLFGGLANRGDHVVPDRQLRRLAARHVQIARLEEACVPVHLVTFDLLSGREVLLCNGPAHDAVVAAAAIPGVLPPVPWGEHLLVDGGVVNNTPISHAVELGAERIFVLPTVDPGDRALDARPRGARDTAMHAFTLLVGARLQADLCRYRTEAELVVLPVANRLRVAMTDFDQAELLIAGALRAARRHLASLGARQELAA
jgi:NTE family protein